MLLILVYVDDTGLIILTFYIKASLSILFLMCLYFLLCLFFANENSVCAADAMVPKQCDETHKYDNS